MHVCILNRFIRLQLTTSLSITMDKLSRALEIAQFVSLVEFKPDHQKLTSGFNLNDSIQVVPEHPSIDLFYVWTVLALQEFTVCKHGTYP